MEPTTTILGGIVIAFAAGGIGKYYGGNNKVSSKMCSERRTSCQELLVSKIDTLDGKVDNIIDALKSSNITII